MAWKLLVGTGLYRVGVGLLGGSAGLIKERKGNGNYCTYNLFRILGQGDLESRLLKGIPWNSAWLLGATNLLARSLTKDQGPKHWCLNYHKPFRFQHLGP